MASWNPSDHPRGPIGRFVTVAGPHSPSPRLRAVQEALREKPEGWMSADADLRSMHGPDLFDDFAPLGQYEQEALGVYVEDPWANRYLRGDVGPRDLHGYPGLSGAEDDEDVKDQADALVSTLDEAIEKNILVEDTTVYRGVKGDFESLQPGDQIHDLGFTSTSLNPNTARSFGSNVLQIELPAGTEAAIDRNGNKIEAELLLGRGAVFEVDGIEDTHITYGDTGGRPTPTRMLRARLVGYVED